MHSIIHISDIHIRAGNHDKSRYTEYLSVFDNLFQSLSNQQCIQDRTSVIVVTGDLFHHKNKLEPYGLELALHLLRGLAALAPVFVIRGNHDYRQDVPKERDMISALMSYQIPNVNYLDKTGVYTHQNLSFGLVAIQDTLLYGATTGISPELPPFPKGDSEYNVALFHGTIAGCTLQTGQSILHGYPIDWFQGFDAILLGDIHLQQINRAKPIDYTFAPLPSTSHVQTFLYDKESPWGYPGSLVQQDFGEPLYGHGYLLWNLKEKIIHAFHVHNPYGFIKTKNDEIMINKKYTNIKNIISQKWFPNHIRVSVLGDGLELQKSLEHKNIMFCKISEEPSVSHSSHEPKDVLQINSLEVLTDYLQSVITKDNKPFTDSWKGWLKNPELLILSVSGFPEPLAKKISERSDKILKASSKYLEEFDKFTSQHLITGKLHIHNLQWNWILNYRDGNYYDFDTNAKQICIVNAKNGSGKSNFLEIICIALFGEGFPSRENLNYTVGMICDTKPVGVMANTSIVFSLNDKRYSLQRVIRPNSNARWIHFEKIVLSEIIDGQERILHQQKGAVHPWIESHLGTLETYLMTAMLSQNSDKDFFSLDKNTQKMLLDRIMSLDHINSLKAFLKETDKYYKYCCDLIETYYDGAVGGRDPALDKQLEEVTTRLQTSVMISTALQSRWNHVSERDLMTIDVLEAQKQYSDWMSVDAPDLSVLQTELSVIEKQIATANSILITYHSYSDIIPDECVCDSSVSVKDAFDTVQSHPYYKTKSLYELQTVEQKYVHTDDSQKLFDSNKEFETWDSITKTEYSETFDDTDVVIALGRCNEICTTYPERIKTISGQVKLARKKFLRFRKQKDELADMRPNRPSKTKEWLDETAEMLACSEIDYMQYRVGFLQESVQRVPALCASIQHNQQKCLEMAQYLSECAEIPFNAKCKACKMQPWKKTFDTYEHELPLLERSVEQEEAELEEYICEDIPFCLSDSAEYIRIATEMLSGCTRYIQLHELYAVEHDMYDAYYVWQTEYDNVCELTDAAERECDQLEVCVKGFTDAFQSAFNERQDLEHKIQNIQQKKTEWAAYCSERDRRLQTYHDNIGKLEYSWFYNLAVYHNVVGALLQTATQNMKELQTERERILLEISEGKERIEMHRRASELRLVMEAMPHWTAWKSENESIRQMQLLVRELETRCGNKVEGIDIGGIRLVMEVVSYLSDTFDGYREWLYKAHIAPLIEQNVNKVLEMICEDRPLRLEGEWLEKIQTLSWFVRDGSSRPVIEKASGFQRFIVGMACRVAFHQIGFCRIQYDQLFLDEGFTSCDSDNLERVPDFLRGLLRLYDSIYLATHLDELKVCAHSQIMIERDASGLSQIRSLGVQVAPVMEPKKKGRPSKKSIMVNRLAEEE